MTLVQFLAIGSVILILIKTISDFQKKKITLSIFLFWLSLWLVVIIVVAQPRITLPLAKILGVERGMDVTVYFSILFIFFALFRIVTTLEKTKWEITEIVRHLSLKNSKKK